MSLHYLPAGILLCTILILLAFIALKRSHGGAFLISGIGLIAACLTQINAIKLPVLSEPLFIFTQVNALISALLLGILVFLWSQLYHWFSNSKHANEEYYLLLLTASLGALTMISSQHFASFFLGLELMGLSFVGLIAYSNSDPNSQEAGVKYLVLSAGASAFILMGIALFYLQTGSLSFDAIANTELQTINSIATPDAVQQDIPSRLSVKLSTVGMLMILAGLCFKLSLIPCHLWVADIFEGAPLPTTALLAIMSKLAAFVVLWRIFTFGDWQADSILMEIIAFISVASMLMGNLLALQQTRLLRILAFSSISHFGYLLIVLLLIESKISLLQDISFNIEAMLFYLIAYLLTLTGTFSILMQLGNKKTIDQLNGLFWQQPLQAICLSILMLSLAGIPLTIGFMGKFYLITAAISGQLWWPLGFLVIASVIGLFFYLRIIMSMLSKQAEPSGSKPLPLKDKLTSWTIISVIIGLGVFPTLITDIVKLVTH
ncbi:NADH-quinone oxidoreductase subunit N [Shewanella eurypsychrophilus]|uniref:NADH-quinone oxidoreductase subunit N n=1 Tax=Shewanella eurypsychrophilus TaxID=2593656 RepID=A0ABX6V7D2_9GAMM|nr:MULTISPECIES: NADH-quinone oxidoreductase subunit N [Shewanella]QFU23320.1 NADH-quinone oxidoreductase subunit N [Shewanella sp. YLB-09]QPG58549.1 NADH-quinone oxidoreductase subunit N [Shewanella eurypsychrophilus]